MLSLPCAPAGRGFSGTHRCLQVSSPERGVPMGCRVRGGGFLLLVQRDRDEVLSSRGRFGHVLVERRELEPGRLSSRSLTTTKKSQHQKRDGQQPLCYPTGNLKHKIRGQKLCQSILNETSSSNTLSQKTNKQASKQENN